MRPPPGPSDATPAAPSTDRDAAFERDVLRCLPDVARFARALTHDPVDADDLVQETFLQAYRGYHTFRPGHDARRWLFTICRHAHTRQRTRDARLVESEDGSDAEFETLLAVRGHEAARRVGEDALFERLDLGPAIDSALADLPTAFRLAVVLVDMEGQSYGEAAAVQGVPVGTIRSRLFRARRLLQERLLDFARDAGYVAAHARQRTGAPPAPSSGVPVRPRRAGPDRRDGTDPQVDAHPGTRSSEPPAASHERSHVPLPTSTPSVEDPIA
jgi:RNA polymerase sigma-70 factor (ECF subfamily)